MEANTKPRKELSEEEILKFKRNMTRIDHSKNLMYLSLFSIPGIIMMYLLIGEWLVSIAGILVGLFIILAMRYKMKYLLLPWEMRKLMRNLGYL